MPVAGSQLDDEIQDEARFRVALQILTLVAEKSLVGRSGGKVITEFAIAELLPESPAIPFDAPVTRIVLSSSELVIS